MPLPRGHNLREVMGMSELPVGFVMTLAMNERAMKRFAQMPEEERRAVIARAHGARSRDDMQRIVEGLE